MAKEKNEEGQNEEKAAKPKSNLGMLIVIIAAVLVIQIVLAFAVVTITAPKNHGEDSTEQAAAGEHGAKGEKGKHGAEGGEKTGAASAHEVYTKKPYEIIVNIAGTDATRFLKVEVQVAYDGSLPSNKEFASVFTALEVPMRNYINQYLSSLTLEEVTDRNAQQNIRGDLLRGLNELIPEKAGEISSVYITQYIIQ